LEICIGYKIIGFEIIILHKKWFTFPHGYSDSEFAGDRETRKSVFGFITFLCGAPISWKSKACHSVTLSSTEAEYYAGSETAKEMMFIKSIL
jgi:hypothetical protein